MVLFLLVSRSWRVLTYLNEFYGSVPATIGDLEHLLELNLSKTILMDQFLLSDGLMGQFLLRLET